MDVFISPSSVGYLFAAIVSFITAYGLYRRWLVTQIQATKTFVLALLYLGVAMFMFGFPPFFFKDDPQMLGWLNVLANITLGLFHTYNVRSSIFDWWHRLIFYCSWSIHWATSIRISSFIYRRFYTFSLSIY